MQQGFSQTIPTFQVRLDSPDDVRASVEKIKRGPGHYTLQDISHFGDWVGLCTMRYMIDSYAWTRGRPFESVDLQNMALYQGQCAPVCRITNDLLLKTGVGFTGCDTSYPCRELQSHCSMLAHFQPKEKGINAFFDSSLRQFFDTDNAGVLQQRYWLGKIDSDVAENLISTEPGRNLTTKILQAGWTVRQDGELEHYIDSFVSSTRHKGRFHGKTRTRGITLDQFILNIPYRPSDSPMKVYTVLPGEAGADTQVNRIFRTQDLIHP